MPIGLRCKDELIGYKPWVHCHTAVRADRRLFHWALPFRFEFSLMPGDAGRRLSLLGYDDGPSIFTAARVRRSGASHYSPSFADCCSWFCRRIWGQRLQAYVCIINEQGRQGDPLHACRLSQGLQLFAPPGLTTFVPVTALTHSIRLPQHRQTLFVELSSHSGFARGACMSSIAQCPAEVNFVLAVLGKESPQFASQPDRRVKLRRGFGKSLLVEIPKAQEIVTRGNRAECSQRTPRRLRPTVVHQMNCGSQTPLHQIESVDLARGISNVIPLANESIPASRHP